MCVQERNVRVSEQCWQVSEVENELQVNYNFDIYIHKKICQICTTRNVATEKTRERKLCQKFSQKNLKLAFVFVVIFVVVLVVVVGPTSCPFAPFGVGSERDACKSQKLLLLLHFRALSARGGYKL